MPNADHFIVTRNEKSCWSPGGTQRHRLAVVLGAKKVGISIEAVQTFYVQADSMHVFLIEHNWSFCLVLPHTVDMCIMCFCVADMVFSRLFRALFFCWQGHVLSKSQRCRESLESLGDEWSDAGSDFDWDPSNISRLKQCWRCWRLDMFGREINLLFQGSCDLS